MPWYQFTPTGVMKDPSDPNQYTLTGSSPVTCAGQNVIICSIQAQDNMGKPTMTLELISEMTRALENKITTPNVFLKP